MCSKLAVESDGYSPQWPVDDEISKIAYEMKAQIELQTGQKFEYYQPLVYRRSPYMDSGGIGPVLTELDYIIKVSTKKYTECIHISVHQDTINKSINLNAFQLTIPLNAALEPIFLPVAFMPK